MEELRIFPGDAVQEVLDRAAPGALLRFAPGIYREKLMIRTPGLRLQGAGPEDTVFLWDDYAKKPDEEGREYNTFRTWTVAVTADGVSMADLAVVNAAGDPGEKGQEVALSVYGDRFTMENCLLRSTQDTLFLGPLPEDLIRRYQGFLPDPLRQDRRLSQRFDRCRIEGSVDFIFGCGAALFHRCRLVSVFDGRPGGYVAAPAHALSQEEGFLFRDCDFTAEAAVAEGSVYLARPWRDHGLAVFENCRYGPHIAPAGFDPWRDSGRERTARFRETPPRQGRVPWAGR